MPNTPITEWYANLKASVKHNVDATVKPTLRFYKSLLDTVNQHTSDINLVQSTSKPSIIVTDAQLEGELYTDYSIPTLTADITFVYIKNIDTSNGSEVFLPDPSSSEDKTVFISNINAANNFLVKVTDGSAMLINQSGTNTQFTLNASQTGMFSCKSGEWVAVNIG